MESVANLIAGIKPLQIKSPDELEQEAMQAEMNRDQIDQFRQGKLMREELKGVSDPQQIAGILAKYDPIKGMQFKSQLEQQQNEKIKLDRQNHLEGVNYLGKQAGILVNLYDDAVKQGLSPQDAEQKIIPLFQQVSSRAQQLYPNLGITPQWDGIDSLRGEAMQADDFMKQYMDDRKYSRERSDKLADNKEQREYEMLKEKERQGFDLSKMEIQRKNELEKLGITQSFQAQQNSLNRGVTIRGQNMTDARARDSAKTSTKETPVEVRTRDANDALEIIKQARPLLDDATGSYIGSAVDFGANVFGGATKGQKATAKLKALEGMLISKMPKMSGPQSDKDVFLYKQMAGQIGDSTIPTEVRKSALDTIEQLQMKYAGQQSSPADMSVNTTFQAPPNPSKFTGKTIVDDKTGIKLRSNGKQWLRVD